MKSIYKDYPFCSDYEKRLAVIAMSAALQWSNSIKPVESNLAGVNKKKYIQAG